MKTECPHREAHTSPRRRPCGLASERSGEGASSDHRPSWRAWPPGPAIADPRAIGRAGIKAASAIPGSREPGKRRGGLASERPASIADPRAKRRGGQPKNQNALKHGFYSRIFKDRERALLEQMQPADLSAEIELIRVTSARFLESLAASREPDDFEANLTALRLVNLSAQSIAMLLRVQVLSGSLRKDMDDALKALEEVAEKLNITEDPIPPTTETPGPVPAD